MAPQLAAAAKSQVTLYRVAAGGPNDVFSAGGVPLWDAVAAFVLRSLPPAKGRPPALLLG
jgi:hypothetical protein